MIKRLVGFLFILFILAILIKSSVYSGSTSSADYGRVGGSGNITVSTSTWTAIPTVGTQNISRIAVEVDLYNTNLGNCLVQITTTTLPPSTTSQGRTMKPNDPPWTFSIPYTMNLWAVNTSTTPEALYYQELLGQ